MTAQTPLQPPSVLLMGRPGSGKTYSISTLIEAGIEVFVIGTEPGFIDTLLDALAKKSLPVDRLHWRSLTASAPSWAALDEVALKTNTMSYADLADLKGGIAKQQMKGWMELLTTCKNFRDDRTGNEYGDVTKWDDTRALVVDSLSGLNDIAREHVTGYKPNLHPGEWGTAMELERNLIRKLVMDRGSYFVLTAHLDRTADEVSQAPMVTVAALGNKLGPKLPKDFSEVVLAQRPRAPGDPFTWSTVDNLADVKNRALPVSSSLPASFASIVDTHKKRKAAAASQPKT